MPSFLGLRASAGRMFRAYTRYKALDLGLRGWVRNLDDGRVELIAAGASNRLDELEQWLWRGPEMAEVKSVQAVAEKPLELAESFKIL